MRLLIFLLVMKISDLALTIPIYMDFRPLLKLYSYYLNFIVNVTEG